MSDADMLMTLVEQYAEQSAEYNTACSVGYNEREAGYACQRTEAAIRAHIAEVERAARAAALREAAEVCETVIERRKETHGYPHGYNAIMDCVEALRARAEGQG